MSALTRIERLDDLIPEMFRRMSMPLSVPMHWGLESPSEIRIDVTETDKEFLVNAEIPGAKKEDIRVSVDGNYVSVTAEVKKDWETVQGKDSRTLIRETYRGSVSRGFTLPQDVDEKAVSAKLEEGVLHLTLPKRTGSSSRMITIQ